MRVIFKRFEFRFTILFAVCCWVCFREIHSSSVSSSSSCSQNKQHSLQNGFNNNNDNKAGPRSIKHYNTTTELTVTSLKFNLKSNSHPKWIQRILGNRSVFFGSEVSAIKKTLSPQPLKDHEILSGREIVRDLIQTLSPFQNFFSGVVASYCNIEILAFGRAYPQLRTLLANRTMPIINVAKLSIFKSDPKHSNEASSSSLEWICIYRGMHENWRFESIHAEPHYRALFLYCIPPRREGTSQQVSCLALEKLINARVAIGKLPMKLVLSLTGSSATLETAFEANLNKIDGTLERSARPEIGVCTAIPYTTSDAEKAPVNKAMLAEWMRYYSLLGMKILIYDRDEANVGALFTPSAYTKANGIDTADCYPNVHYYNFTVRGLLDSSRNRMVYDNTEPFIDPNIDFKGFSRRRSRFESQGHDKLVTLTHCRFEMKAVFGIERVLVIDFDEFFYCPSGGNSFARQAEYIRKLIRNQEARGTEQLLFMQRQTYNTTLSPRDCMLDKVKTGAPIFDCFAAYEYRMGGHSVKALHLSHVCPLTGYHFSCPDTTNAPRTCDCMCNSRLLRDLGDVRINCAFLHLSVKTEGDAYANRLNLMSPEDRVNALRMPNSINAMLAGTRS